MFNTDSIYRITVPGTAVVNDIPEFFTLGRIVDTNRYDLAALRKSGVGVEQMFPRKAPPAPPPVQMRAPKRVTVEAPRE